jgi:hypothetical protein
VYKATQESKLTIVRCFFLIHVLEKSRKKNSVGKNNAKTQKKEKGVLFFRFFFRKKRLWNIKPVGKKGVVFPQNGKCKKHPTYYFTGPRMNRLFHTLKNRPLPRTVSCHGWHMLTTT